jgi:hypothetical protein
MIVATVNLADCANGFQHVLEILHIKLIMLL